MTIMSVVGTPWVWSIISSWSSIRSTQPLAAVVIYLTNGACSKPSWMGWRSPSSSSCMKRVDYGPWKWNLGRMRRRWNEGGRGVGRRKRTNDRNDDTKRNILQLYHQRLEPDISCRECFHF